MQRDFVVDKEGSFGKEEKEREKQRGKIERGKGRKGERETGAGAEGRLVGGIVAEFRQFSRV